MARSPLPEREKLIVHRLKVWREQRRFRRLDFALELEIRPSSYANYEYARAPLTYGMAAKILHVFSINARWLATGEGPDSVRVPIPRPEKLGVSPRALFSAVYDQHLAEEVTQKTQAVIDSLESESSRSRYGEFEDGGGMRASGKGRYMLKEHLLRLVDDWIVKVPDEEITSFVNKVWHFGQDLADSYRPDPKELEESRRIQIEGVRLYVEQRRRDLGIPEQR